MNRHLLVTHTPIAQFEVKQHSILGAGGVFKGLVFVVVF